MKVLVLAFALASTFGHTQTTTIPSGTRTSHLAAPFRIDWDVRIPMRDDVKLCATVFLPANQQEPLPIILAMTPYTLSFTAEWGRFFAQNGYVFVSVDMRGRGDSEGSHIPMVRDPQDGYDTVEWLARQSWCNGKVGMTGLSYLGGTQWATAKLRPPHLATIIPIASTHPGVDVPTLGGIHFVDTMGLVLRTSGRSRKGAGFGGDEYVDGTAHDFFRSGWPWRELDRFFGLPSPVFQAWMRHPAHDAYWKAATPAAEDYRKLDIPILTITGHYDDDQVGAMTYYRDHMRHGSPAAKDRHFLVIGPWDHMQTRTPALECEGVTFGKASLVDMNALHKAWFDWTLKGGPKPDFLKDRVACYIQGEDVWRYADQLEGISSKVRKFHLHAPSAGTSAGSLLESQPPASGPQHLTHDPLASAPLAWDQKPAMGGLLVQANATMVVGKRQFHHEALSYLTEPFAEPSTLCGSPSFSVWVRMTGPHSR